MKRKPKTLATRNPFVVLAMKRKAGTHRKPNKAIRRAEKVNTRALSPATDSLVVFENALPRWRNGSRAGLRNQCLRTCRFESDLGHQFFRTSKQGVCGWLLTSIERGSIPRYGAILMLTLAQW